MPRLTSLLLNIAALAGLPWVAYELLTLAAGPEAAWRFVAECLWLGTPVLVLVAALRGYGEGLDAGRAAARPRQEHRSADATTGAAGASASARSATANHPPVESLT